MNNFYFLLLLQVRWRRSTDYLSKFLPSCYSTKNHSVFFWRANHWEEKPLSALSTTAEYRTPKKGTRRCNLDYSPLAIVRQFLKPIQTLIITSISKAKWTLMMMLCIATESCLILLNLPFKRVFGERFTFLAFLQNLLNRFQRLVLLPIETSLLFEWLCVSFPSRFHFQRSIFPGKMGLLVDLKAQDIYSNTSSRGLFHFT